jgi:peptidoglycan hydrolase-like protein with peptidoglycan-binding domain
VLASNLASICRTAGLNVREVPGWATRGHGELTAVRSIIVHHTAGPSAAKNSDDYPTLRVATEGRSGLAGPLYNLGLGRSGRVYVIAAGLAYHAGGVLDLDYANVRSLGIGAENDGIGEPWPKVQIEAYNLLCAALCDTYKLPSARVYGHREVCAPRGRKIDPVGIDMTVMRGSVARELARLREEREVPVRTLRRYLKVREPMMHGGKAHDYDIESVQHKVGVTKDGWYGPLTASAVRAIQRRRKLLADGIVGPDTARALGLTWAGPAR